MFAYCWLAISAVVTVLLIEVLSRTLRAARIWRQMPPGPRGIPVLGNLLRLPNLRFVRFMQWKEQYSRSDIYRHYTRLTLV